MLYRIYRRDPVKKGEWYHSVNCRGCGRPIYMLDDTSNGTKSVSFAGDGELLVSCLRCAHDDRYAVSDIKVLKSKEDMNGARPARIRISKSSRKPLLKSYSKANAIFGVGYIEDRPAATAIVGRIITSWADIEVGCARLLAELMGTNIPAAAAVFSSLRSSRAQHDALTAVAEAVLDERDLELFSAFMMRRASLEKERNDLAHGCFAISVAIPDHIIWVSQADFIAFNAKPNPVQSDIDEFRKKQFVYELGTLERISQEISGFFNQLGEFTAYLRARREGASRASFRAERYLQLCSQSHIRQALDRIRTAKKAEQAPRKSRS